MFKHASADVAELVKQQQRTGVNIYGDGITEFENKNRGHLRKTGWSEKLLRNITG